MARRGSLPPGRETPPSPNGRRRPANAIRPYGPTSRPPVTTRAAHGQPPRRLVASKAPGRPSRGASGAADPPCYAPASRPRSAIVPQRLGHQTAHAALSSDRDHHRIRCRARGRRAGGQAAKRRFDRQAQGQRGGGPTRIQAPRRHAMARCAPHPPSGASRAIRINADPVPTGTRYGRTVRRLADPATSRSATRAPSPGRPARVSYRHRVRAPFYGFPHSRRSWASAGVAIIVLAYLVAVFVWIWRNRTIFRQLRRR